MNGYGHGPPRPGVASTLAALLVGMVACAGWAWSAYPAQASALADRLTGSDYLLLAAFVAGGLVAASMLASMAQALVQLVVAVAQVALLVGVAIGGVVLWRNYQPAASERGGEPSVRAREGDTATAAPDPRPVDADELRRKLEAELRELDARDGRDWWEQD